jgi:hypothetical protein
VASFVSDVFCDYYFAKKVTKLQKNQPLEAEKNKALIWNPDNFRGKN